jgi:NAD(P)-dependent dehydrogenase (short-subunit alcohol dehydrogenase family)
MEHLTVHGHSDADAVHQAAQQVGSMLGNKNLVGLVNNAEIVVSGPLLYLKPSEFRRQLDVNLISPFVVTQAFAPLLGTDKKRQRPTGRVVNISSTAAKVACPLRQGQRRIRSAQNWYKSRRSNR